MSSLSDDMANEKKLQLLFQNRDMANMSYGIVFLVVFVQCCAEFNQGTPCTPSSKFLQRLIKRSGYQPYYCNGSCFVKKVLMDGVGGVDGVGGIGGVVTCINVKKRTVAKADGITFTIKGNPNSRWCR